MADWRTLAEDSYAAASLLFREGKWRSAVSRAYYAAYSRIAQALIARGVVMPLGREGPSHKTVPVLVEKHLTHLKESRWQVSGLLQTLYAVRLAADYRPSYAVDNGDARRALSAMASLFRTVKE